MQFDFKIQWKYLHFSKYVSFFIRGVPLFGLLLYNKRCPVETKLLKSYLAMVLLIDKTKHFDDKRLVSNLVAKM